MDIITITLFAGCFIDVAKLAWTEYHKGHGIVRQGVTTPAILRAAKLVKFVNDLGSNVTAQLTFEGNDPIVCLDVTRGGSKYWVFSFVWDNGDEPNGFDVIDRAMDGSFGQGLKTEVFEAIEISGCPVEL